MRRLLLSLLTVALAASLTACSKKPPASAGPAPPPPAFPGAVTTPPRDNVPPPPVPPIPNIGAGTDITSGTADNRSVEEINKNSPLKPAFFGYDSDTLDDAARKVLSDNAQILTSNSRWVITIEGHCDERGTAEYNLALGDRRALAAKNYLLSLGVTADRLKTVSYGKEFPFDPGHDEDSWIQNRRAHFTLTAK
jgi:peptidoglycan-associated lipoprotein